jgi:drug/metabolite transporter (DMT)-like permease
MASLPLSPPADAGRMVDGVTLHIGVTKEHRHAGTVRFAVDLRCSAVIPIVLAAVSAVVWGSADYCGGRASRRANALTVTVVSQLFGLPVLVAGLVLQPGTPRPGDILLGALAGAAGLFGIVLLYRSLSTGAMAVAAPITAVTGALVPVVVGLITERLPSAVALGGAICAVLAIGLVSLGGPAIGRRVSPRAIGLALTAGLAFGLFFSMLAHTDVASGLWPLAAVRLISLSLGLVMLMLAARRGATIVLAPGLVGWVALAGVGDLAANVAYLVAARDGLLSIIAPIAALYPVSTVLLAFTLDKERVRPIQVAGLGLAAAALVLTAI